MVCAARGCSLALLAVALRSAAAQLGDGGEAAKQGAAARQGAQAAPLLLLNKERKLRGWSTRFFDQVAQLGELAEMLAKAVDARTADSLPMSVVKEKILQARTAGAGRIGG